MGESGVSKTFNVLVGSCMMSEEVGEWKGDEKNKKEDVRRRADKSLALWA